MIIVKLQGGLGNQLFQYAFARSVSKKLGTDFRLDRGPFDTYYKLHKYSLQHFRVLEKTAKTTDFLGFVWFRTRHKLFDTFYKHLRLKSRLMPFYYPEQTFHFDSSVFKRNNTYFDGFWQTEKYFKDMGSELLEEITLKNKLSEYSESVSREIEKSNAVSIHVRRADYVQDPATEIIWGSCDMDYYKRALDKIMSFVQNPHFFVFSDDHKWAEENFKSLPFPVTCIKNTAEKNYEDLILMSRCRHNIIANSSFSWWGAWLNQNRKKIVIGPAQWFKTKKMSTDTKDILPPEWIKL